MKLLTGSFGRNVQFYYCTRDPNQFSGRRYWPSGNYCILKQGISCPTGDFLQITKLSSLTLTMILLPSLLWWTVLIAKFDLIFFLQGIVKRQVNVIVIPDYISSGKEHIEVIHIQLYIQMLFYFAYTQIFIKKR